MSGTVLPALPDDVEHIDFGSPAFLADVQRTLADWATRPPFWVADQPAPALIAGRYDDVKQVLGDAERFVSAIPAVPGMEKFDRFLGVRTLAQMDGDPHLRLRRLMNPAFSPKAVAQMDADIVAVVEALLDDIESGGPQFDGVAQFADLLPKAVLLTAMLKFCEDDQRVMLDMHRTIPLLTTRGPGDPPPPECVNAFAKAEAAIHHVVAERRQSPGDDFISYLVDARDSEDRIDDRELFDMVFTVCVGALGATAMATAGMLHSLVTHRDQLHAVRRDPELAGQAVEECLRFNRGAFFVFPRIAAVDTEVGGVHVPSGAVVRVSQQAANYDPRVYPDPLRFDIHRQSRGMLSFGFGLHQCLGHRIARSAMRTSLVAILRRFPDVRLTEPRFTARFGGGIGQFAIQSLPLSIA